MDITHTLQELKDLNVDHVTDAQGNVVQQGTKLNKEFFDRLAEHTHQHHNLVVDGLVTRDIPALTNHTTSHIPSDDVQGVFVSRVKSGAQYRYFLTTNLGDNGGANFWTLQFSFEDLDNRGNFILGEPVDSTYHAYPSIVELKILFKANARIAHVRDFQEFKYYQGRPMVDTIEVVTCGTQFGYIDMRDEYGNQVYNTNMDRFGNLPMSDYRKSEVLVVVDENGINLPNFDQYITLGYLDTTGIIDFQGNLSDPYYFPNLAWQEIYFKFGSGIYLLGPDNIDDVTLD